jgi:pyrimidine-specific ribonucleoside hydrolase
MVEMFVSQRCISNGQVDAASFQTLFSALLEQTVCQLADGSEDTASHEQCETGEAVNDEMAVCEKVCKKGRWRRSQAASAGLEHATFPAATEAIGAVCAKTACPVAVPRAGKIPLVFDMETGDPDDVLTLLILGSHPEVELRAVTITPGTEEQVALVRWLLQEMNLTHVRLGAQEWPAHAKKGIGLTGSFYKSFGRSVAGEPRCERADAVLLECCDASVTLLTGAPLHNLGAVLKMDGFVLGRWVAQGGFAGEGVVPRELQMDKFKGMETCPTWNFGGNIAAAEAALRSLAIERKVCVSKNVCHSVVYDDEFHMALGRSRHRHPKSFGMMYDAMDDYLRRRPGGKKLHDPLALAVAIDESVCKLVEVHLFCQKGKWGSKLCPGSNIWISIAYDVNRFRSTLLM